MGVKALAEAGLDGVVSDVGNPLLLADFAHQLGVDKFVVVGERVEVDGVEPAFGDREAGEAEDAFENDVRALVEGGAGEHDDYPRATLTGCMADLLIFTFWWAGLCSWR